MHPSRLSLTALIISTVQLASIVVACVLILLPETRMTATKILLNLLTGAVVFHWLVKHRKRLRKTPQEIYADIRDRDPAAAWVERMAIVSIFMWAFAQSILS